MFLFHLKKEKRKENRKCSQWLWSVNYIDLILILWGENEHKGFVTWFFNTWILKMKDLAKKKKEFWNERGKANASSFFHKLVQSETVKLVVWLSERSISIQWNVYELQHHSKRRKRKRKKRKEEGIYLDGSESQPRGFLRWKLFCMSFVVTIS